MLITRKIGKFVRGKATPVQLMFAAVLGSMIGFVPGFEHGPGLTVALLLLLIVLNANLGVALVAGLLAKALSFFLLPVSFYTGRVLLDGPTQDVFQWMINTPVLALFGFEHYATTGGMIIGIIVGLLMGFVLVRAMRMFRARMMRLEEHSERYKRLNKTRWARVMIWVLLGKGHGKKTYAQLMQKRIGNPIRPMGVVLAALFVVLLVVLQQIASEPIITMAMQRGLERTNGATVDLQSADLDLRNGKLNIAGLAMADPNNLETDIFRAVEIESDITTSDLLRKRLRLDRVVIREAQSGVKRDRPGRLVKTAPRPPAEPDVEPTAEEKTIDDYIADAKKWKKRLAQIRRWLESVSGPGSEKTAKGETLRERIERAIREKGYAQVVASHLIDEAPTLLITELIAEGVRTKQLENEVLDIYASNLSTHPHLVDGDAHVVVKSRSETLGGEINVPGSGPPTDSTFAFFHRNLSIDRIASSFKVGGEKPISGGTIDVAIDGSWSSRGVGFIDLPLNTTLRNTTINVPGVGSSNISEMSLPIGLRGPMDSPYIIIDDERLAGALADAGARALAEHFAGEAGQALDDIKKKAGDKIGDKIGDKLRDSAPKGLGDLFGGNKKNKKDNSNN